MSSTTATSGISTVHAHRSVWLHGIAASVVAAAATSAVAAVASAAGVSFADRSGASIPVSGFATLTLFFSLLGVGLAAILARKARHPRRIFVRTTLALVVLSFVPDVTFGFDPVSAATLMADHVLAAAIVITTLARRL